MSVESKDDLRMTIRARSEATPARVIMLTECGKDHEIAGVPQLASMANPAFLYHQE